MNNDQRYKEILELCGGNHKRAKRFYAEGLTDEQVKEREELAYSFSQGTGPSVESKKQTAEQRYTEEFNSSPDMQAEFGGPAGLKNYIAYRKAEAAGLVGVM